MRRAYLMPRPSSETLLPAPIPTTILLLWETILYKMTSTQNVAAVITQLFLFSYLTLVGVGVMLFNLRFPLLLQITDLLSSRACFLYFQRDTQCIVGAEEMGFQFHQTNTQKWEMWCSY